MKSVEPNLRLLILSARELSEADSNCIRTFDGFMTCWPFVLLLRADEVNADLAPVLGLALSAAVCEGSSLAVHGN